MEDATVAIFSLFGHFDEPHRRIIRPLDFTRNEIAFRPARNQLRNESKRGLSHERPIGLTGDDPPNCAQRTATAGRTHNAIVSISGNTSNNLDRTAIIFRRGASR